MRNTVHTILSSCASGAAGCCRTYLQIPNFQVLQHFASQNAQDDRGV